MYEWILKINEVLTFFLNLVWLNILWTMTTLLGLIVFSVGPSTYALTSCIKELLYSTERIAVTKLYFTEFKSRYKETLLLSWFYILVGHIIVIDLIFITNWYLKFILFFIAFFYILSLTFITHTVLEFQINGLLSKVKTSFLIGFGSLHYSVVLYLTLSLMNYLLFKFVPGILFFAGISFNILVITWFTQQIIFRLKMQEV